MATQNGSHSKVFIPKEKIDQFEALILQHVKEELPESEWEELRDLALDQFDGVKPRPMVDPSETPEQLISNNVAQDSGEDIEVLIKHFGVPVSEIGSVDGCPVLYLEGTGIYLCDPKGPTSHYLSFWISFPAYPQGW